MLTGLGLGGDDPVQALPHRGPRPRWPPICGGSVGRPAQPHPPGRAGLRSGGAGRLLRGGAAHLTRGEYAICAHLAAHPAQTFTKEQIYEAVFGFDGTADSSAITEHIKNIPRQGAGRGSLPHPDRVGVGYKWGKRMRRRTGLTAPVLAPARHRRAVVLLAVLWWGRPVRPAPQRLCPPGGHRRRAGGRAGPRPGGRGS